MHVAVKVNPRLHWKLQYVGNAKVIGHLSREAVENQKTHEMNMCCVNRDVQMLTSNYSDIRQRATSFGVCPAGF